MTSFSLNGFRPFPVTCLLSHFFSLFCTLLPPFCGSQTDLQALKMSANDPLDPPPTPALRPEIEEQAAREEEERKEKELMLSEMRSITQGKGKRDSLTRSGTESKPTHSTHSTTRHNTRDTYRHIRLHNTPHMPSTN